MEQELLKKKKLVNSFLKKGLLLSSEVLKDVENEKVFEKIDTLITPQNTKEISVLNLDIKEILDTGKKLDMSWIE